MYILVLLKFTPLEFETIFVSYNKNMKTKLKFTPLEFETYVLSSFASDEEAVKIYSVGV